MTSRATSSRVAVRRLRRCGGAAVAALGLLALAAGPAAASNVGGGTATGQVFYTSPGVPPAFAPCAPVTFSVSGQLSAFVFSTEIDGFAGNASFSGTGKGNCEGTTSGGGSLTVDIPFTRAPNGSTFECTGLKGGYTRAATDMQGLLGGHCAVNANPTPVMFVIRGEFSPSGGSGLDQPGVSRPITRADFRGSIVVLPA